MKLNHLTLKNIKIWLCPPPLKPPFLEKILIPFLNYVNLNLWLSVENICFFYHDVLLDYVGFKPYRDD